MPSLKTIKSALKGFSDKKGAEIKVLARDTSTRMVEGRKMVKMVTLIFDNVQHYRKQWQFRLGQQPSMIIGIFGTYSVMEVQAAALDVLDKRRRLALNLRKDLTTSQLLGMIDQPHIRQIGCLQWIQALTTYIPEFAIYKKDVHLRYRTRVAKQQNPLVKSDLRPLASSGKNEAYIPELKDCFIDFLQQLGQTVEDHDFRLWFAGGDGMSFNNMLLLKKYLQNHGDSFENFELMQPILQSWHTMWTDLSRIFSTHWGGIIKNNNPASIGHSAKKIGRPPPPNMKKVDYYPCQQLLNLIHDTRMLDCWRYVLD